MKCRVKEFRDCMVLAAACFLIGQAIWFPFSKDVCFKFIAAMLYFFSLFDMNDTRQRIFIAIGTMFFFIVILISYKFIQI
jgi:hypothetical protein